MPDNICMLCDHMVCGTVGELTKLRAYDFQFWFQVLPVAEGRARDDCMAHTKKF